ncbi:MAPEG family protein [Lentisalinibacter salinarum]|uniref:MAPEG family protein n=1 Tax=Lentisalinibacter salinarum TaxID=2992239 RepID=UPI00386DD5FC
MTTELKYLALAAAWNAVIWIPYILNMISVRGLKEAVGYPDNPAPMAAWAERLKAAHYNAVENLVLFAAVILVADAAGIANDATAASAVVFFWARVVHTLSYTFAVPWVRTLSFAVGWAAVLCILSQILL